MRRKNITFYHANSTGYLIFLAVNAQFDASAEFQVLHAFKLSDIPFRWHIAMRATLGRIFFVQAARLPRYISSYIFITIICGASARPYSHSTAGCLATLLTSSPFPLRNSSWRSHSYEWSTHDFQPHRTWSLCSIVTYESMTQLPEFFDETAF